MERTETKTITVTPTESSETTVFMDDAPIEDVIVSSMSEDTISVRDTGIPAFMARPQLITTGTWSAGSAANTIIYNTSIAAALAASTVWIKKLDAFNLIRGKACIRLQINANPFQAGRLLMHFIPCASDLTATGTPVAGLWNTNLTTKTTQLGVELDARSTAAIIKIPYVGPNHYYDRVNQRYDWGTIYLSVLSPLLTGAAGETGIDYSIFMWFEDFELAAPCYPQASRSTMGRPKNNTRSKMRAVATIEREKDVVPMTPIADALGVAGKAVGSLSAIPGLAPFTGPTSWALEVASGAASFFGWSKPEVNVTPGVVIQQSNRFSATSDGVSPGIPLALTAGNHLRITDCCSARGEDEMSFSFLKQVPAMIGAFQWTTASASGDVIYNQQISPGLLCNTSFVDSGGQRFTYVTGPPMNYLSESFNYWRGSIKVRMSFVKTMFHSGRLLILFDPIVNGSVSTFAASLTTPMLRMVVDIREADELEFELPFYAPSNYLRMEDWSGRLQVQVLSDLRAPETVGQSISILPYYSAGDSLEFALPRAQATPGPFATQANMIGGDPPMTVSTEASQQSQGEIFTSVRQLVKRFTDINFDGTPVTTPNGSGLSYWPWHTSVYSITGSGSGYAGSWGLNGDAYGYLSPLYAFYRGGIDIRCPTTAFPGSRKLDSLRSSACIYTTVGSSTALTSARTVKGGSTTGLKYPFNGLATITASADDVFLVPYQSRTHCSLNAQPTGSMLPTSINPVPNVGGTVDFSQPGVVFSINSLPSTAVPIQRAVGEDFQFSYFIGTVPRLTVVGLIP